SAVVGYPDPRLGEVAVVFVLPASGAAVVPDELIAFCRGRIASFKIPRHVFVVDEFPMTSSGKVQKARLREMARERLRQRRVTITGPGPTCSRGPSCSADTDPDSRSRPAARPHRASPVWPASGSPGCRDRAPAR